MQNIDTDQIIPAEYLTLVPTKVRAFLCHSQSRFGTAFVPANTPTVPAVAALDLVSSWLWHQDLFMTLTGAACASVGIACDRQRLAYASLR